MEIMGSRIQADKSSRFALDILYARKAAVIPRAPFRIPW